VARRCEWCHPVVRVVPAHRRAQAPVKAPAQAARQRDSLEIARTNFGFTKVEIRDGGIGYLKLDRFVPRELAEPTAIASMAKLASARAVVLDLRENPGGSPDMVSLLMSYFLGDKPQLIHASYWRAMNLSDSLWSHMRVPGERMTGRPLYVLTSRNTASAAEMFAYGARRLGVATLVGETTAGAGQGGMTYSVGEGVTLFSPERKVLTGPGWEGVGVAPDVAVPADQALESALEQLRR
jgi:retinol-binding protein 3